MVTEELLRSMFQDTIGRGNSQAGIYVLYNEGEVMSEEFGVPYNIENGRLVIGPYVKNVTSPPPEDFEKRKKSIPIGDITGFDRKERG